jgi:amidohydrolase
VSASITSITPDAVRAQVVAWRRHLHQHPELSFHEHQTAQFVADTLAEIGGFEITRPTATSVMARLCGGAGPGPVLGVRADMDALPILEANTHDFVSKHAGVMHACGHDGHTAMLLGAAQVLASRREELRGEVRFLFQHAEELYPGGATEMVTAGVLDGVSMVIGSHLWLSMPVGQVGAKSGVLMASNNTFRVTIQGEGGHAAIPQQTIDPIVTAADVVMSLQHIVTRNVDPLATAVISVTQINGGTTTNVIPSEVTLTGTVRTIDPVLRERIPVLMERVVAGVTAAHGARYRWEWEPGYAAVVNDETATALVRRAVVRGVGAEMLVEATPTMGSEDFSAYQQRVPGAFFFIGARNEARGIVHPHHHERFDLDERALDHGTRIFVAAALEYLGNDVATR